MKQVSFREPHSGLIRLWHWANMLVVGLLLFTVFVTKTYLSVFSARDILYASLIKSGASVSKDQAFDAVFALRDHIWIWHTRFGYTLAILFFFRLFIEMLQVKEERFFFRMRKAIIQVKDKEFRPQARHYLVVKMIYFFFYALMATITFTGLWMATNSSLKQTAMEKFHSIKEIHENAFVILLLFILLHLAGLVRAERKKYKGVVSDMINGGDK